jgi:hypothetical protein
MEMIQDFLSSDAGKALVALLMTSAAATIVNIFVKNEDEDAPTWRKYVGMFLRALSGSVGKNTTKKSFQ